MKTTSSSKPARALLLLSLGLIALLASATEARAGHCTGSFNPPGPAGGAGHGRFWHYNAPGAQGGPGRGWVYNPPGRGNTIRFPAKYRFRMLTAGLR